MPFFRASLICSLLLLPWAARAQSPAPGAASAAAANAVLQGRVLDPTGAVVAGAKVAVIASNKTLRQAVTSRQGTFALHGLPAGGAQLVVTAPGFAAYRQSLALGSPAATKLTVQLALATSQQHVSVQSAATTVSLQPADRAGAVTLSGQALQSLSSDPDQLQTDLLALAGPAIGGGGGTVYINGFTQGDIPPKSAISSVKVNNDPFAARYARLGYGRIEIETKPGAQNLHGDVSYDGNTSRLNALNPFLTGAGIAPPQYHSNIYSFDLGGPAGKSISWLLSVEHRDISNINVINAQTLDSNLAPQTFIASVPNPNHRTAITPQLDVQLTPSNTLSGHYEFLQFSESGNGVGGTTLPTAANSDLSHRHNLQIADTQILGPTMVNVTSYQFLHHWERDTPASTSPTLQVLGAFTTGGNANGAYANWETHNDLRDDLSLDRGAHQIMIGGEVRQVSRTESNAANYNGAFVFSSLADYQATQTGLQNGLTMAQIQAAGNGPSQFKLTAGAPLAHILRMDASLYAQDTWRLRSNLTATYGLRFESENMQHDHSDWAPRLGVAWGLGGSQPSTVLRAGFGVFYERLDDDQMIVAAHSLTSNQRQYIVNAPAFYPNLPAPGALASLPAAYPTTYTYAPLLQAPLTATTSVSLEHQFGRRSSVSLSYLHSSGSHLFLTNDINAPLPGTFDPAVPGSGTRPLGNARGNIYEYQSRGIYRQNQLTLNFKAHPSSALSLSGYYTFNNAHTNTGGADSFPANPWNLLADYGRAPYDVRHRFYISGTIALPWGFSADPFLVAQSGQPFSLTLGEDLYGTGQQNARPALAGPNTPSANLVQTPYGTFDRAPLGAGTGAIIAPNTATGPAAVSLNLRLTKDFKLTLGDHRYQLSLGASARNLLNAVNLAAPVGNLNSPRFGQSISLAGGEYSGGAANRRIDIVASVSF